ncbi:glycosyltransferase family 2 protein [Trichocoleus desertorum AS-A10]|uniref:glycosyltransferase family 2 protein n=1 Tax=Trichocoleus desertorum TaxID=1481672 RepID=UPI003297FD7F
MSSPSIPSEPLLSLCMIVKNEQQNLPRCLNSVRSHVDEMIVVDTGSEDGTIAIAQQYGAQIQHFQWCDDFAAARNFAIAQASGQWILMLDADEELVLESDHWREELSLERLQTLAYWIALTDIHQDITDLPTLRLFRNSSDLKYVGRYHEQLVYREQLIPTHLIKKLQSLKILHYGYEEELLLQKNINRDIPLLERVRQQETLSLLLLMTLADTYVRTEQVEKARECWSEAFERISPNLLSGMLPEETVRLPALLFTLGLDLLHEQEDYETTMLVCRRGLEWFPTYPPLNHLTGSLFKQLGFSVAAIAYFEKCLQMGRDGTYFQQEPFDLRFLGVWPAHDLGLTYMEMNQISEAIAAFELALSFEADYSPVQADLEAALQKLHQS